MPIARTTLRLAAVLLPVLLTAGSVQAQERIRGLDELNGRETTGSAVREQPATPQTPAGHRQPRGDGPPAAIPRDASDDRIDQINRSMERRLWFCRGC